MRYLTTSAAAMRACEHLSVPQRGAEAADTVYLNDASGESSFALHDNWLVLTGLHVHGGDDVGLIEVIRGCRIVMTVALTELRERLLFPTHIRIPPRQNLSFRLVRCPVAVELMFEWEKGPRHV